MKKMMGFLMCLVAIGMNVQAFGMDITIADKNGVETDEILYENLPVKKRCCINDVVGKFRWYEHLYIGDTQVRTVSYGSYLNDTQGNTWATACSPGEGYSDMHDLAPADYRFVCEAHFEESGENWGAVGVKTSTKEFSVLGSPWYNLDFKVTNEAEVEKTEFTRGERIRAVVSLDQLSQKGRFYAELLTLSGLVVTKKYGPVYDVPPAVVWKDTIVETIDLGTPDVGSYQVQLGFESDGVESLIDSTLTMIEVSRPKSLDKLTIEVCSSYEGKKYCIDSSSKYKELPSNDFMVVIGLENIRVDHQVCYTVKKDDKILLDQCNGWQELANDESWTYETNPRIISDGFGSYSAHVVVKHEFGEQKKDISWSLVKNPMVDKAPNMTPVYLLLLK